jgi:cytochrome c-type biogenesis protein CcmH
MTVFWLVAAMLLAGALLMLVPPLWRGHRVAAATLALLLPVASVLSYLKLGDLRPLAIDAAHAVPRSAEGWVGLGRAFVASGRFADAAMAWRRALELMPGNPTLLADLADVLAMAQGKRLAGEPARLVQQALDADPRHVKALALAGSVAFEARDYGAARGYWQRLLALVPAQSEVARSIEGSVAQAVRMEAALAGVATPVTAAARLTGEVRLSPALASRVAPGDTLFVFARAAEGPRMPLAIVRQPVGAWPLRFALGDAMAMSPELRLSAHPQVVVGARVSRGGSATPQSGDLFGASAVVASSARDVQVVIDQVQP